MITLIEALNYRCLRYIHQPLDRFHVLVGPNASGKTTFLDIVSFVGSLLSGGLQEAIRRITPDPRDLLYRHSGSCFEFAVESAIPDNLRHHQDDGLDRIRYEVAIAVDSDTALPSIRSEAVRFTSSEVEAARRPGLFPEIRSVPDSIVGRRSGARSKAIVGKNPESGKDNFYPEVKAGKGGGWVPSFQLGPQRSAFANLPEDETRFPVATWFKDFLSSGVQQLILDSLVMRLASAPGQPQTFKPDGSNLPWVVENLRHTNLELYRDWIAHIQTALPDLSDVRTVESPDTKHRHLVLEYAGGLEVPSWTASDGTLRLLALTLPPYLPALKGVFLIEEPENGIHPKAIETMFQSLSNVYDAQVLMATHSPIVLSIAEPEQVLCFAKNDEGATDIVRGDEHPALVDWQRDTSLGVLFAAGVLG